MPCAKTCECLKRQSERLHTPAIKSGSALQVATISVQLYCLHEVLFWTSKIFFTAALTVNHCSYLESIVCGEVLCFDGSAHTTKNTKGYCILCASLLLRSCLPKEGRHVCLTRNYIC